MKKFFIFLAVFLFIILLLHAVLFIFINAKGKGVVIDYIKKNFNKEASLGSLSLTFPFGVEAKDFKCEDLYFTKANISLGSFNPLSRTLILNKVDIEGLNIKLIRDDEKIYVRPFIVPDKPAASQIDETGPELPIEKEAEPSKTPKLKVKKQFNLTIKNLEIKDAQGELTVIHDNKPMVVGFKDVDLQLWNVTYPGLAKFYIKFKSSIFSTLKKNKIMQDALNLEGWVDYPNRNMSVDLDVNNFDYLAFSDYYPPFLNPYNLRIKEALISMKSNLKSKDNELTIDALLTLEKIEFAEELAQENGEENEESFKAKTLKTMIAFLKGDREKATLSFKLKTKMDSPTLDLSSLKGLFKGFIPINRIDIVGEAIKGVKDKVQDTGKLGVEAVVDVLKGAAETFGDTFKNKTQEESD